MDSPSENNQLKETLTEEDNCESTISVTSDSQPELKEEIGKNSSLLKIKKKKRKFLFLSHLFDLKQAEVFKDTGHLIEDGVITRMIQKKLLTIEQALRSFAFMSLGLTLLEVFSYI